MNRILTWTEPERQTTRSKAKFNGVFKDELEKTITMMELYFENELSELYVIDSVLAGANEIKIRVNDEEKWIRRMINCIFRYHHDEAKHGNINIELGVYEVSKKTKVHFVGTFKIKDRERIKKMLSEDVIASIEAIY